jgi:hypothetical protein
MALLVCWQERAAVHGEDVQRQRGAAAAGAQVEQHCVLQPHRPEDVPALYVSAAEPVSLLMLHPQLTHILNAPQNQSRTSLHAVLQKLVDGKQRASQPF